MKQWYVIQVYAGYEVAVKRELEKCVEESACKEDFGEVLVPSAKVKDLFDSDEKDQQLFPGYVFVEMELKPELVRIVNSIPKVLKFLGGKDPVSLTSKEVQRILGQIKGEIEVASKKSDFVEGKEVEVGAGPFAGFVGVVDRVDEENERLTVMVSIFGRMTPVELGFDQVKR
jgi:transcriptional antiterminator NusG